MKKVILAAAFVMGLATVSFAGNPKGETKAETPTESKVQNDETTYYVIGQVESNYTLSTNPADAANCGGTPNFPCQFTSPNSGLGTSIAKSTVDNEDDDIVIEAYRETLP